MKKRILIIEDDRGIRLTVEELLTLEGYATLSAGNGVEALEILRTALPPPDLILLDYSMPEMGGAEFRSAQESDMAIAEIPVVLITADAHSEVRKLQIGAKALITKPIDIDILMKTIKDCIPETPGPREPANGA